MKQVTPSPKKGLSTVGGLSEEVMLAVYVTAFEQKMERSLRGMRWRICPRGGSWPGRKASLSPSSSKALKVYQWRRRVSPLWGWVCLISWSCVITGNDLHPRDTDYGAIWTQDTDEQEHEKWREHDKSHHKNLQIPSLFSSDGGEWNFPPAGLIYCPLSWPCHGKMLRSWDSCSPGWRSATSVRAWLSMPQIQAAGLEMDLINVLTNWICFCQLREYTQKIA